MRLSINVVYTVRGIQASAASSAQAGEEVQHDAVELRRLLHVGGMRDIMHDGLPRAGDVFHDEVGRALEILYVRVADDEQGRGVNLAQPLRGGWIELARGGGIELRVSLEQDRVHLAHLLAHGRRHLLWRAARAVHPEA